MDISLCILDVELMPMKKGLPNTSQDKSIKDLYSENPNFVTINKAAKVLGVSKDTLRRWEAKGKISSVRTASGYRLYDIKNLAKDFKKAKPSASKQAAVAPISFEAAKHTPVNVVEAYEAPATFTPSVAQQPQAPQVTPDMVSTVSDQANHSYYSSQSFNPEIVNLAQAEPAEKYDFTVVEPEPVKMQKTTSFSRNIDSVRNVARQIEFRRLAGRKVFTASGIVFTVLLLLLSLLFIPGVKDSKTMTTIGGLFGIKNTSIKPSQEIVAANTASAVLSASSISKEGKFLQLNLDTNIVGNLAVEGEGVFTENITAPNIVYTLVPGTNISITGDPQNPTISATGITETDTLQSVTARGSTTTIASTFSGGLTASSLGLTGVLNLGQLTTEPSTAEDGTIYYNTGSNKFRCYINGSWADCDTQGASGGNGTVTSITAGDGLTGGTITTTGTIAINLPTSGVSAVTSSNSGLEVSSSGVSLIRGCTDNQTLSWNAGTSEWECTTGGGGGTFNSFDIQGDTGAAETVTDAQTVTIAGGTNIASVTSAPNTITLNLDDSITLAGNLAVNGGTITSSAGTLIINAGGAVDIQDTLTVNSLTTDTGGVNIASGQTLTIGTTSLNEITSNTDSGAFLVGVFDEFINSSSTNVQGVLKDLDSAIGAGSSKFTQASGFVYLTNTTDDFVLGGTTIANGSLYFDESAGNLALGTDESLNGTLTLYSSGVAVTDPTIAADANGRIIATSANFNTTTTGINSTAIGQSTAAAGSFTTLSASSTVTIGSDSFTDITGNGLTISGGTVAVNLISATDGLGTTSSASGMAFYSGALSLLQGCADSQILKWTESSDVWACANDSGGATAIINVEEGGVSVGANIDTLNFSSVADTDFSVTDLGSTDTIDIDYTNFGSRSTPFNIGDALGGGSAGDAKAIDIGGNDTDLANTIRIATNGTSADVISIGNSNASTTIALTGGNDWSISAAGAAVFSTVDTGQGANELYDMDQNVLTTSNVTFNQLTLTTDLTVANGGTGASTFTSNGVLYGNGASAIGATAAGTDGQLLLGVSAGAPAFATMSGDATIINDGTLTISPNSVALGTDTTGAYVATVTGNTQVGVSGSGGETAAVLLSINANSLTPTQFAAALTFADGDYLDLSAIVHDDSALQGLRLPNTGASPTNPTSGEGQIAYNASTNSVIYYNGSSWEALANSVGTGTITAVGDVTSGDAFTAAGGQGLSLYFTNGDVGELTADALTGTRTWTLPDASGTVAVSASGPIALSAAGDISCSTCLTTGTTLFTITDGTTPQTITSGNTMTFVDGTDINVVTSATDTVTINDTSTLATVTGRGATTTTLVNLDGGIAVDSTNFTVSGTTGAIVTASTITANTTGTINGLNISSGSLSGITGYTQAAGSFNLTPDGTNDIHFTVANASGRFLDIDGLDTGSVNNALCQTATGEVVTCTYGGGSGTVGGTGTENFLTKWSTGGTDIEDSLISDDGTTFDINAGVFTVTEANGNTDIAGTLAVGTADAFTVSAAGAIVGTTLDTGQGANELYDMDQNVLTTSNVTFNQLTLTTDLTVANGGTGASTFTAGGVLYGNGASALAASAQGTSGQALVSGGSGAPTWTTGTLTLTNNLTVNGGNVTIAGQAGGSSVTLPASGTLCSTSSCEDAISFDNGLTRTADNVQLGGDLIANTTITQSAAETFNIVNSGTGETSFNLASTGDLNIKDNGTTFFSFVDDGTVAYTGGTGIDTETAFGITANSLTTGTALQLTATALTTGSFFDINNGSSIFNVSNTSFTTSLPSNFTAPGDTSFAYDINFTNPTAAFIKSYSGLTIQPGDPFGSSNLTLATYNEGSVYIPTNVITGTGVDVDANALTTGTAVDVSSTSVTSGSLLNLAQTTSTFTGNLLNIALGNGSGTGLNITNSGSGQSLKVGDGTDLAQFNSTGDLTFVDANGAASITGPAGGAFTITASNSQALNLTTATAGNISLDPAGAGDIVLEANSGAGSEIWVNGLASGTGNAVCVDTGSNNRLVTCTVGSGGVSGSGNSGQVAFFNGTNSITSESAGFGWDTTNKLFSITSNVGTTTGAGAATGLIDFASTSLTTGTLLNLELTEATLNGGHYLKAWDATGSTTVFSIGEDGRTIVAGVAEGTTSVSLTAGDLVLTDGDLSVAGGQILGATSTAFDMGVTTSGDILVTGDLSPITDDTYDLGDNTHRWANLFLGGETLHIGASTADEATLSYTSSSNTLALDNVAAGNINFGTGSNIQAIQLGSSAVKSTVGIGDAAHDADYLLSLTGNTTHDFSRLIDITQANDAGEDSTVINIANTVNPGTVLDTIISNYTGSLTPTFTISGGGNGLVSDIRSSVSAANITIGNGDNAVTVNGGRFSNTASPTYNSSTSADNFLANGVLTQISGSPTLTSVTATSTYSTTGGSFSNTSSSAGNANLTASSYGIVATATGNLTTTGTTTHYGGSFTASGTADTNYGLYTTASGATTNHALYVAAGNATFADGVMADLSAINHSDASNEGLRLPMSDLTTNGPAIGDGFLAFDTGDNQVKAWYGGAWNSIAGASTTLQQAYEAGNSIDITSGEGALDIDAQSANVDFEIGEGTDTGDFRIWDGAANWLFVDESADTLALGAAAGSGLSLDANTTVSNGLNFLAGQTTGKIGFGGAVSGSDYLLNMTLDSTQDWSRGINISQANDTNEDSDIIYLDNTANLGTVATGTRNISNYNSNMTPTATLTGATLVARSFRNNQVASNITVGDGTNDVTFRGFSSGISGTPVFNSSTNADGIGADGIFSSVSLAPTLTSVTAGSSFSTNAGYFTNTSSSAGNANLSSTATGIQVSSSGNLTTTGTTQHLGLLLDVGGTADNNYGIFMTSVGSATNNTGIYIQSIAAATGSYAINSPALAQSYFAGNVGIGDDTTPDVTFEIEDNVAEQFRLGYDNTNYTSFAVSNSGDLTVTPTGGDFSFTGNADITGTTGLTLSGTGSDLILSQGESINNDTNNQIGLGLGASGTLLLTSTTTASITNSAGALAINATATGLNLQADGSVDVNIAGGSSATGCTIANASGNLSCSGTITSNGTQLANYWSRSTTTLSPATANDVVSISSNDATNPVLSLTASGTTTGNAASITANALTAGNILSLTSSSTAAASNTQTGLNVAISGTNAGSTQTTYGAQISNTHAGTASTNIGAQFTATGGTAANTAINVAAISTSSTTNTGINVAAISGATNNYAVKTAGGSVDITDTSNTAASLALTNNTATTIGNGGNTLGVIDLQSTSVSTGNFMNVEVNGLTTGTGINLSSTGTIASGGELMSLQATGITTGRILDISSAANTLTTGQLASITTSSSALTGSTTAGSLFQTSYTGTNGSGFVGNLNYFDYSPGSTPSTSPTGDLMRLHIGANATNYLGNLFNIVDDTSSVFSVSKTAFTTSLPSNFTAAGDVSIAYDQVFTNPTASFIKSAAPLSIVAGETFNSSNLTLQTYNQGTVVFDTATTTGTAIDWTNSTLTSGIGLNLAGSTSTGITGSLAKLASDIGSAGILLDLRPDFSGAGVSGSGIKIAATDSTSSGNTDVNISSNLTLTGNAAKSGFGFASSVTTASTTGDTLAGISNSVSSSGNLAGATTRNLYGGAFTAQSTATSNNASSVTNFFGTSSVVSSSTHTAGTSNAYGNYISVALSHNADAGTVNNYGLFVANGSSNTNGTSNKFGIYLEPMTGADSNVGICFDCDGTFGTQSQATGLQWGSDSTSSQVLRLFRSNGAAAAQFTIEDGAGTDIINGSATTVQLNLSAQIGGTAQRVCHGGADASTGLETIGDCGGTQADIAEWYGITDDATEGDVVTIAQDSIEIDTPQGKSTTAYLRKTNSQYEKQTIGVISTNPSGEILGDMVKPFLPNPKPIALAGRVPVKVSTENGPILSGDYLTSSSVPGVAMKATRPGVSIGRAMAAYNGSGVGKVVAFINAGYSDPQEALANLIINDDGSLQASNLNVNKISVTSDVKVGGIVSASNFSLNAANINRVGVLASLPVNAQNQVSFSDTINMLAQAQNTTQSRIEDLEASEASTAAALADARVLGEQAVDQVQNLDSKVASTSASLANLSSQIDSLLASIGLNNESSDSAEESQDDNIAEGLTPPTVMFASDSATLDTLVVNSEATVSGSLTAYDGIFQNSLKSLGDTFLGKTNIAGDLSVDGTFSVTEGSKVNALPILYFQTNALAEAVDFFNGLVTITKEGFVNAEKIIAKEVIADQISVTDKTAGTATITAGTKESAVFNNLVKSDSIVIITPETTTSQPLAVSDKVDDTGFVVKLTSPATTDIKFSYLIVGQK